MNLEMKLPQPGQIITISDDTGKSWQFGVKFILAGNRILCDWMQQEASAPAKDASGLKMAMTEGIGASVAPIEIVRISPDGLEYKLALVGALDFVQRREYWRLPDPKVGISYKANGETFEPIKVTDISGGGIGMKVAQKFEAGVKIEIDIALPNGQTVHTVAEIMRSVPQTDGTQQIGICYVELRESEREKIIKYILGEQVKYKIA